MISSPPSDSDYYYDEAPSFSFSRVFLLFSLLSSLIAWLALFLPWEANGELNGMGIPVGTYTFAWTRTGWAFAASVLLGLNIICSLLWLWRVTRLTSLLIWVVQACLNILMIVLTKLALVQTPAVIGLWVYLYALVGMLFCDLRMRKHYRLPEIFTTPLGEETLRPPG